MWARADSTPTRLGGWTTPTRQAGTRPPPEAASSGLPPIMVAASSMRRPRDRKASVTPSVHPPSTRTCGK